jgi:hypothetical protein
VRLRILEAKGRIGADMLAIAASLRLLGRGSVDRRDIRLSVADGTTWCPAHDR